MQVHCDITSVYANSKIEMFAYAPWTLDNNFMEQNVVNLHKRQILHHGTIQRLTDRPTYLPQPEQDRRTISEDS